jgi:septal ring factor EnvC (AmiA/AmiB activator)
MVKILKSLALVLCLCGGFLLTSCSSSPSDEELAQLKQLQDQVTSLKQQLDTKQRDKAALEKQIAEKNGKLQQCQSDQEAVKKAMGGK